MAFNGDGQKLVGDDGYLQLATTGATIDGDGVTPLPVGTYVVTKVAGASSFPAAALGGTSTAVGDILIVETGNTITPAVDDDVVTLTLADQCDISSWQMQFSKDEIEVTTLCDAVKKYRAGKPDMQGTASGVFVVGTSNATSGFLRQFIDLAFQDGDNSFDRFTQQATVLLGFFYANYDLSGVDKHYVVAPVELYGNSLGGQIGENQGFEASFRFGDLTVTDGNGESATIQPTFYRLGDGS